MTIQLYPHQLEYLNNMPKNVIMSASVGLGKTYMSLEHYRRYRRHDVNNKRLLIVAPASKVKTQDWQRAVGLYFSQIFEDGTVTFFAPGTMTYQVMSYEMFSKKAKEFVDSHTTIIFDEIHFIANASAKRSKIALQMTKIAAQWIGLSATSLPNGWRSAETYAIMTNLSRNKTDFVQRFVIIDRSRGFPLILGYREQETLTKWWNTVAKPLERTEALPSKNIPISIPMSSKVAAVYSKALNKRLITVEGEEELLDSPSKVFVTLRKIPTPTRIDALQSIVESTNEHIVVFYNFNVEREAIYEMLNKSFKHLVVYEQSGHASHLPDAKDWGNLAPSITLVQYQSGSQAIELQYTSITVYFSPPTSWANYEQSRGRNLRNGQDKIVLFYHISVQGSLDDRIWGIVKKKGVFNDSLIRQLVSYPQDT